MRDPHETSKVATETWLICSILDAHFEGMQQRVDTTRDAYNGLARGIVLGPVVWIQ
jgi:hypothetical protein